MRIERLKNVIKLTPREQIKVPDKLREAEALNAPWDLSLLSDSVELEGIKPPKGEGVKELKKGKLAAEMAYLASEVVKTGKLKELNHVAAETVEAINLATAPYLLGAGVKELREALKSGNVWDKLHAVRDITMGGAGLIEGVKGVSGLLGLGVKSALPMLGPIGSALAATHGVIEVALGARELKHAAHMKKGKKLKILDSLSTIALGSLITAGAFTGGTAIAVGIAANALLKLGIALYERYRG